MMNNPVEIRSEKAIPVGYKNTELGLIPEDWDVINLNELASFGGGTTPSRALFDKYYSSGVHPWAKTLDLNNGAIWKTEELVTDSALNETSLKKHKAGSVLIAMYGGFNQIGRTGLLKIDSAINQALVSISPHKNKLTPEYLLYNLNYNVDYWKMVASSSRKDPNITSNDIKQYCLPLPSVAEQIAIANVLSDTDALITELEHLISKKQAIKTATMQQLLTGNNRLPEFAKQPDGVLKSYQPSELGIIPEDWEIVTMGEMGATYGGLSGKSKDDFGSGNSLYVPFTNIMANVIVNVGLLERVNVHEVQNPVLPGDLLFNGSSEIPEEVCFCSLMSEDIDKLYLNSFCFGFRANSQPKYIPLYLAYWFRSDAGRTAVSIMAQGSTRYNISKSQFLKLKIVLPSKREQTAIATILSDMDAELAVLEKKLAKARDIIQGMMQQLLTGRIRLPLDHMS
ncbi:restriction endonuclease subunit S [Pantoea ananatis]|uniref:restriction endonuclease subunit S n=1 Tax=Pantoea ananas TaxID=553 RepID=UPI000698122C|nr:restriction endonuclease subunit S [Pantoea ananatis]